MCECKTGCIEKVSYCIIGAELRSGTAISISTTCSLKFLGPLESLRISALIIEPSRALEARKTSAEFEQKEHFFKCENESLKVGFFLERVSLGF